MADFTFYPYSFVDTQIVAAHPDAGDYIASGKVGLESIVITMTTTNTGHRIAADGAGQLTYKPGRNGDVSITMLQTSSFHQYLLGWSNLIMTAAENGDLDNFGAMNIAIRNIVDKSVHTFRGVSPEKAMPDKTYDADGGTVTWRLMAMEIINL